MDKLMLIRRLDYDQDHTIMKMSQSSLTPYSMPQLIIKEPLV